MAVRRVVAGQAYEGLRVITKGLDSGASVIVDGLQMIRPGLAVRPETVEMTRRDSGGAEVTAEGGASPPES